MAEIPADRSSAWANGLRAYYGSERAAARAAGISRSALFGAASGKSQWSDATRTTIEKSLGRGAFQSVERIAAMIQSVAGDNPRAQQQQSITTARAEKRTPGAVRFQANQYAERMREVRLSPWGEPLDSRDRPIRASQQASYHALLALYESGSLDSSEYEDFVEYQMGLEASPLDEIEEI